jgi:hypothetical protein
MNFSPRAGEVSVLTLLVSDEEDDGFIPFLGISRFKCIYELFKCMY